MEPEARTVSPTRLTVVIPTYNRRESLRRCLEGLLACHSDELDVTVRVVDDGSTDGSPELVRELAERTSGAIRVMAHAQEHAGPGAARNLAIRASDTELVLFLDDDCVPNPGWLHALANAPWASDVGAVGGRIISPESGNRVARYCRHLRFNEFPVDDGPIQFVNTANAAYRRDVLLAIGLMEPSVSGGGEAQDLAWRIVRHGLRLEYAPEAKVLHYHRESVEVLARTFWTRGHRGVLRRIHWGDQPPPTWGSLFGELRRLGGYVAGCLLIPANAVRHARRGVPAGDALPFAALDWLRRVSRCWGNVTMLHKILTGRQSLERTGGKTTVSSASNPATLPTGAGEVRS
jgi:GT2 family glycosyltransferase